MKILGYEPSSLDDTVFVVTVKCETCGRTGVTTCTRLSDARSIVCQNCKSSPTEEKHE